MLRMLLMAVVLLVAAPTARAYDYALEQAAMQEAIRTAADCVVQIRTVGGFERVGDTQISQGPTTGLIVSADGYIVSSAFNFAQRPSSILVSLPGGVQRPAELVARDQNRMLVLLKVTVDEPLPVPTAVRVRDMAVGQTAIALGRTFQSDRVDTSLGIISGLNRMHGRVIQTDCNVSAANYGGPLVDLHGRVFGVLVPMSPQPAGAGIESEVAGAEFYDSGIGFAVPLEHVLSILDRWKGGDDLVPGKLGVSMKSGSAIVEPPVITSVWPGSPAAVAGWTADDTIVAVNGKAVRTQNELQLLTRPLYAGDSITISLRRGKGEQAEEFDTEITLAAELAPYRAPFLGVLPAATANDDEPGVVVGQVWPGSPAAKADVEKGDRITALGDTQTPDLAAALKALQALQPEEVIEVKITRGEDELSVSTSLATLPEDILPAGVLGSVSTEGPTELRELESLKLPQFPHEARYLTPAQPTATPGLVVWLAATADEVQPLAKQWQAVCDAYEMVLLVAPPAEDASWQVEDLEYLDQLTRMARAKFSADPQRTIIGGSGKAGQLAYALGLRRRGSFSGIVADNAPLPRTMKVPDNSPADPVSVLALWPRQSPFAPLINHDARALRGAGFPVTLWQRADKENDAGLIGDAALDTIARWIAGLRRL